MQYSPKEAETENRPGFAFLELGSEFPLNLERLALYIPDSTEAVAEIQAKLRMDGEQVVLLLSVNAAQRHALLPLGRDPGNLIIVPDGAQLTALWLAAEPLPALARLIASQIVVARLSPYQVGGGTSKETMFYGRGQLLAHVLNREPANYLLVGGRQLGKSTLLKALERRYRERPAVHCCYLALSGPDLPLSQFAEAVGLPQQAEWDAIAAALRANKNRRYVFLLDEADEFVSADAAANYPMLQRFRALSEEGRAHFMLAGFWDLYRQVRQDYHSPLKNFGEILEIGALEPEAMARVLERLTLAYVLQRRRVEGQERYHYPVLLLKEWIIAQQPAALLRAELATIG